MVGSPLETLAKTEESLSFSGQYTTKEDKERNEISSEHFLESLLKTDKNWAEKLRHHKQIQQMYYTDWPTRQLTDNTVSH